VPNLPPCPTVTSVGCRPTNRSRSPRARPPPTRRYRAADRLLPGSGRPSRCPTRRDTPRRARPERQTGGPLSWRQGHGLLAPMAPVSVRRRLHGRSRRRQVGGALTGVVGCPAPAEARATGEGSRLLPRLSPTRAWSHSGILSCSLGRHSEDGPPANPGRPLPRVLTHTQRRARVGATAAARAGCSRTDRQNGAGERQAAAGDERNPKGHAENDVEHEPCHGARDETDDRPCCSCGLGQFFTSDRPYWQSQ
jgi:hypothetical protein